MTVPLTRTDHTPKQLRALAKRCNNGPQARRLRAIALVMEGDNRQKAAESEGMDRQTLRDWVHRYNESGDCSTARVRGGKFSSTKTS